MLTASAQPRLCSVCNVREFWPRNSMHVVCGYRCATKLAKAAETARKLAQKVEKAQDRAKRERLKKPNVLKGEAQDAFNDFVRWRDRDLPCVSCGIENPPMTTGGQWDAGHFLSRGSHPELAFDEDNCHRQCKSCNGGGGKFKHKERVVSERYEEELVKRIGQERVDRLKGPHSPARRKADDFRALREEYRAKLKALKVGTE
jgi:hypothetical protein